METPVKRMQLTQHECKGNLMAVGDALYVIGGKWKLRIIVALFDGGLRFNELQRLVEGISAKVLSAELKELELNGFVQRRETAYELTEYSATLDEVLQALSAWGKMHREKLRSEAVAH